MHDICFASRFSVTWLFFRKFDGTREIRVDKPAKNAPPPAVKSRLNLFASVSTDLLRARTWRDQDDDDEITSFVATRDTATFVNDTIVSYFACHSGRRRSAAVAVATAESRGRRESRSYSRDGALRLGTVTHRAPPGCIPKMVLLQLPLKRWEFCVMRAGASERASASEGKARREKKREEGERASRRAVASAVTAVTAVILLYAGNKCAPLTHASAIALSLSGSLVLSTLSLCLFPLSLDVYFVVSLSRALCVSRTMHHCCSSSLQRVSLALTHAALYRSGTSLTRSKKSESHAIA